MKLTESFLACNDKAIENLYAIQINNLRNKCQCD